MKLIALPLRTKPLEITLYPDRVRIIAPGTGRQPPAILADLACAPVDGVPRWQPALDTLKLWLSEYPLTSGTCATVLLSSHFVRYAMLPWSEDLIGHQEEAALAGIVLERIYEDAAQSWQLAVGSARYGEPRLIAAIDATLLQAFAEIIPGPRLKSVRPLLTQAFAALSSKLPAGEAQFAVVEAGVILLLGIRNKRITHIKRMLTERDAPPNLAIMLAREALLNGYPADAPQCYCLSDHFTFPAQDCKLNLLEPDMSVKCGFQPDISWQPQTSWSAHRLGWGILLLAVLVAAGVIQQQIVLLEEAGEIRAGLDQQKVRKHTAESPEAASAVRKFQLVQARLTFPWGGLLKTLESSSGENVALIAVEPDIPNRQVKLEAEARDWDALIEYIGKLDGEGVFAEAHLVSHRIEKSDPQLPVRFVVLCGLR
ncbi:MAG: hypothetical protein HY849_07610 [Nitrosomonadales bacterium]|nr:hypothetical protein [Nitrosomonadales bacterium]